MLSFRLFLENKAKSKIAIFDFDDTLVMTPHEAEGKDRYQQVTGKPWPHKGWWGRKETLKPPIFNAEPHEIHDKVVAEFRKAKADPSTQVVLLTGRHGGLKKEVKAILARYGLEPDEEYYADPRYKSTWDFKHHVVTNLLAPRPGIEEIGLWDDREEHMPLWIEVGKWIRANYPAIQRVVVHDAKTGAGHEL